MKKIKLFSLVAAALFAGSTMAVTLPQGTFSVTSDGTELSKIAFGSSADVHYATAEGVVVFSAFDLYKSSDVTWQASANGGTSDRTWTADTPFKGSAYYHTSTTAKCVTTKNESGKEREYCYRFTNAIKVQVCGKPSTSKNLVLSVYEVTGGAVADTPAFTTSSEKDAIQTIEELDAAKEYVLSVTTTCTSNVDLYEVAFYHSTAPKTEPWLTLSATEVELAVTPFAASDEAKVTLKGGNLTAGNYTLTVPNVAGLTVEPASVTVAAADGTVNQDIKLTYTSTVDVPEATAKVSVTINELPAELTITYSARTTAYTQTTVSDSTTWDWSKAGATTIQFTDASVPSKSDTILLANVEGIVNDANFNSQALSVCGEYMFRIDNDKKFFQGGYISFNAERKGFVTVNYSNTGANAARSLVVNGTKDAAVSSADTKTVQTSSKMSVNAGKVVIMFAETADDTNATKYARVYSVTYTVDKSGDIGSSLNQAQVEAKAVKVIRDGQLLIIRDGKTYTAQGVEVR